MTSADRQGRSGGWYGVAAVLIALLAVAAVLRLYNVNWDSSRQLHPDERAITMFAARLSLPLPPDWDNLLDPAASTLNPQFFAYGSFTMYLLRLASAAAGWFEPVWGQYEYMTLVGRTLSALFDLGVILLVFALGARMYGRWVGVLGAAFVTFTVFNIQLAHFYAADTPMTFCILLALVMAERSIRRGGVGNALGLGAALGLALSFKFSAAPALILAVAAPALRLFWKREEWKGWSWPTAGEINRAIGLAIAGIATAALVALALQPYAIIDFANYAKHIAEQNAMVRGQADLPYTRQYVGTTPYLYFLENMVRWGYGLPLGVAAVVGWLYVMARQAVRPRRSDVLLLAWVVPYFLITGTFYAKFMRYLMPIMPVLALFAAVAVFDLGRWLARVREERRAAIVEGRDTDPGQDPPPARGARWTHLAHPGLAYLLGGAVLLGAVLYALAFMNVYAQEHPRLQASRWIYHNIPAGQQLTHEHWDDLLPLPIPDNGRVRTAEEYGRIEMRLYEADNEAKAAHIVDALTRADYVVLSSNRLYDSIPRSPQRYPITTRYYELLFAERLGFSLEREFAVYPRLGAFTIVDDRADESFTVYDHPKVLIFRKTERLDEAELRALLLSPGTPGEASATHHRAMGETQRQMNLRGGTYSALFDLDSLANRVPILWWMLCVQLIGLVTLPLAVVTFRWLPDRGYLLAKPLGLLALTWLPWMVANLTGLPANRTLVVATFALLSAGGGLMAWHWRSELRALWRERSTAILVGEGLFWGAFLLFVAFRLINPDLWHFARGGEKPMDLAYLMAAVKSEAYPPYDPWFAGGFLNYYYYGQLIVATLIKLTGVAPALAYNLAVPVLYAATVGGAFSVAYNLAVRLEVGGERGRVGTGLAAAVFVGVIGNLAAAGQLWSGFLQVAEVKARTALPGVQGLANTLAGVYRVVVDGVPYPMGTDWYWAASRVYPGATVNEFPFFTFLFADLHAHLIALPYALLALGAALNVALGPGSLLEGRRLRSRECLGDAVRWVSYAMLLGVFAAMNAWDFPTYAALTAFAFVAVWYQGGRPWRRLLSRLWEVGALVATAVVFYQPFYAHFQSFYSGVDPAPERSAFSQYLIIHGLFVFVLWSFLFYDLWRRHRGAGWLRFSALTARRWEHFDRAFALASRLVRRPDRPGTVGLYALLALPVAWLALHQIGHTTLGFLLVSLLLAGWLAAQPGRPPAETFLLGMVGLGLALGMFCEVFAVKGDIGRMNTVFKLYLQVWVLWGVASAVALALMLRALRGNHRAWAGAWRVALVLLIAASLVYPAVATRPRLLDRFEPRIPATLDGTAYLRHAVYHDEGRAIELRHDLAAIEWLWSNVSGSPVILEAWTPFYRWGARVSIYTGLPTVVGWDWHQKQQRWGYQEEVSRRVADVQEAYSTPDPARALRILHHYGVEYVYLGELERAYYPPEGLAKFDAMVGTELEVVYSAERVRIFRVLSRGL